MNEVYLLMMKYSLDGMTPVNQIGNKTGKIVVGAYKSRQNAIDAMNKLQASPDHSDDAEYYVDYRVIVDAVV